MRIPVEVTFRGIKKNEEIQNLVKEKAEGLMQYCESIMSCRVAVERPHRHQRAPQPLRIRLDIKLPPGREVVVSKLSGEGDVLQSVLREAFETAARQITRIIEKQRGDTKRHPTQESSAIVSKLFETEGYGFITTLDGRDVYFHKNSVTNNGFECLKIGTGVRFEEVPGKDGPQASSLQIVDPC